VKKDKFEPVRRALSIGQTLSNVAYNIAQDDKTPDDWRKTCDKLRREWDEVSTAAHRAIYQPPAPKRKTKRR
jgi:hypothetical protein